MRQYEESVKKHTELENQCMSLMDKMVDSDTTITDIVDGFFQYKINRYKNRIDLAMKRMRGQTVCDSDIIMADLLEPQYFINSIHDKIVS